MHRFEELEGLAPGIVAGITAVTPSDGCGSESDYGLLTGGSAWEVTARYDRLAGDLGMRCAAIARQVHGVRTVRVEGCTGPGLRVVGEADGLTGTAPGVLLVVTAADCVPVFVVDCEGRARALLHAGWQGTAAGILEGAIGELEENPGVAPRDLVVYLGPAICGRCYEVGSDVLRAFGLEANGPRCVDLRHELARRAVASGVSADRVRQSPWCTRCGPVPFHSHRASGSGAGRMAAFLGALPPAGFASDADA